MPAARLGLRTRAPETSDADVRGALPLPMVTRRTFILTGVAGASALAAAYGLRGTPPPRAAGAGVPATAALDPAAATIVAAVVPAMLHGALPSAPAERTAAIDETAAGVGRAIAGLPPAAQQELAELFALLGLAPARRVLTGLRTGWGEASADDVAAFLERWRTSRWTLLRSAYDGLHQLVLAAWYGNPRSWPAIGYPGPPAING